MPDFILLPMKRSYFVPAVLLAAFLWMGCSDTTQPSRADWEGTTLAEMEETEEGTYVTENDETPFSGQVGGALPDQDGQYVEGELVDGKWHGPVRIYYTDEKGEEFLRVSREYKNGVPVGSSYTYYPNGATLAETRYTETGQVDCAINYDEEGNKTADSCAE